MKIVAFDLRTGGPRTYEHGVIDLGAVVFDTDSGETTAEYQTILAPNPILSYRPMSLAQAGVSLEAMRNGKRYEDGIEDLCAFMDKHRGRNSAWGFEAKEKAGFVQTALRISKSAFGIDRIAEVNALFSVMHALGAAFSPFATTDAICRHLGLEVITPETPSIDAARTCATAVAMLVDQLGRHFNPDRQVGIACTELAKAGT